MPNLVLFDLDDTLVDRAGAFSRWAGRFVDEFNLAPDAVDELRRIDENGSTPRERFFAEFQEVFAIPTPLDELLVRYYAEYPTCFEIDHKTIDALRRLHSLDWKIAVVTNGPPSQMRKLEVTRLVDEVDAVCVSGILGISKPERGIFEEAAARCGRALSGWVVGDSARADIVGGHDAGLRTVWMDRGRTWELPRVRPDAVAASISAAVERLSR